MIGTALKTQKNNGTMKLGWRPIEVANAIGVSENFIRKEIREGRLRANTFGRCIVILNEALEDYLKGNEEK